jgi:hypothetical protein
VNPSARLRFVLAAVAICAPLGPALAQDAQEPQRVTAPARGQKLMLRDGNYHLARSWERNGDRVRFYSIERSAWEEIPADLVDWAATEAAAKAAQDRLADTQQRLTAIRQAQLASEVDVDSSLEIAPGVFLPEGDGLYVLQCAPEDPNRPGQPASARCVVLTLAQISAESRVDKGRVLTQILVPIPVSGRRRVTAAGKAAAVRLSSASPEFFIRTGDAREPELELIRAKVKGEKREIEMISTNMVGEKYHDYKSVPVQRWQLAKGVFRLTLGESLTPGEYVLAEFLPGEGMNLYVWDFGVDAPGTPVKPAPSKPANAKKN